MPAALDAHAYQHSNCRIHCAILGRPVKLKRRPGICCHRDLLPPGSVATGIRFRVNSSVVSLRSRHVIDAARQIAHTAEEELLDCALSRFPLVWSRIAFVSLSLGPYYLCLLFSELKQKPPVSLSTVAVPLCRCLGDRGRVRGMCASLNHLLMFAPILVRSFTSDRSEEHTSELQSLMRIPYAG